MNPANPDNDALAVAVAAAERRIWSMLWDIHPSRRSKVAEAAVLAAAPFLDGTGREPADVSDVAGTLA